MPKNIAETRNTAGSALDGGDDEEDSVGGGKKGREGTTTKRVEGEGKEETAGRRYPVAVSPQL